MWNWFGDASGHIYLRDLCSSGRDGARTEFWVFQMIKSLIGKSVWRDKGAQWSIPEPPDSTESIALRVASSLTPKRAAALTYWATVRDLESAETAATKKRTINETVKNALIHMLCIWERFQREKHVITWREEEQTRRFYAVRTARYF